MIALLFNDADGTIDRAEITLEVGAARQLAKGLVRMKTSGVYRVQIIDEFNGRVLADTYDDDSFPTEPVVGQVVFAGVAS